MARDPVAWQPSLDRPGSRSALGIRSAVPGTWLSAPWLLDRPARCAPVARVASVRVARALRFPGRRGSLSQAAPSRWQL